MKRAGGRSLQGYNVQVVASEEQVILAAEVTQAHNDSDQLEPMIASARQELESTGVEQPLGTVLANGGYWNSAQIAAVRADGIDVIVPTRDRQRTKPRKLAPRQGPEAERIEAFLSKPASRRDSILTGLTYPAASDHRKAHPRLNATASNAGFFFAEVERQAEGAVLFTAPSQRRPMPPDRPVDRSAAGCLCFRVGA